MPGCFYSHCLERGYSCSEDQNHQLDEHYGSLLVTEIFHMASFLASCCIGTRYKRPLPGTRPSRRPLVIWLPVHFLQKVFDKHTLQTCPMIFLSGWHCSRWFCPENATGKTFISQTVTSQSVLHFANACKCPNMKAIDSWNRIAKHAQCSTMICFMWHCHEGTLQWNWAVPGAKKCWTWYGDWQLVLVVLGHVCFEVLQMAGSHESEIPQVSGV